MGEQLTLRIPVPYQPVLEEMIGQQRRATLLPLLQHWIKTASPRILVLYGDSGCGRTYTLSAVHHALQQQGYSNSARFLSLRCATLTPEAVGSLSCPWLFLDDLHWVLGHREWEEALFDLYNRHPEQCWLVSSSGLPNAMCVIPDLGSRLMSGLVCPLDPWTEQDMSQFLQEAASQKGIMLESEHLVYIMQRAKRHPATLLRILERIDSMTLEFRCRVNFVILRKALESNAG